MVLGPKGKALIQSFEKLALTAYQDQGGVWTIGWGHTGPEAYPGAICTAQQADAWFDHDTHAAVLAVLRSVDAQINQNQFDALVSFTFNVGADAEAHSTLVSKLNQHDYAGAAAEFPRWDHVKGQVSEGLQLRRAAEQQLFLTPV